MIEQVRNIEAVAGVAFLLVPPPAIGGAGHEFMSSLEGLVIKVGSFATFSLATKEKKVE
jgi:hypothetical protein